MNAPLYIDIETDALPESECAPFMPEFRAPGNAKDPAKIAEAIAAKKQAWLEDAALDPRRARVLVVGMIDELGELRYTAGDEKELVDLVMKVIAGHLQIGLVVGHNILAFDMPFLIRRAWKLGTHVDASLRRGRYWHENLVDTMEMWRLGVAPDQGRISLDHLAKHLGVGAKTGSGADFAKLWQDNKEAALAYLENDLRLTKACYEKMTGA